MVYQKITPKTILTRLDRLFRCHLNIKMDIEEYTFKNSISLDAYIYRLVDNHNIIGCVSITNTIEYNIHEKRIITLHVRNIDVPQEHRGKGIARVLLLYGLCHGIVQCINIKFSDLEDNTPFANDNAHNLYYEFGYRFKEGDPQEKMLELESFQHSEMRVLYKKVLNTFLKGKKKKTKTI